MNEVQLKNWSNFLGKLPSLFFGLFMFAFGIICVLNADLGMSPWGVLQVGLANKTTLTFGQVSQIIGLVVLILGWGMGFAPGFATIMNMYFVGYFMDVIIAWGVIPQYDNPIYQFGLMIAGILILGIASFFYLNPKLGAGPRDGLMMGLLRKTNYPVSYIRGGIELSVLIIGYLLGGPVGIGTLISAFATGYAVQMAFKIGKYDVNAEHYNLFTLVKFLKGQDFEI